MRGEACCCTPSNRKCKARKHGIEKQGRGEKKERNKKRKKTYERYDIALLENRKCDQVLQLPQEKPKNKPKALLSFLPTFYPLFANFYPQIYPLFIPG